jgi:hypothetical protein
VTAGTRTRTAPEADRRVVRRALRAGAVVGAGLALLAVGGNALLGGDGRAAAVWITSCLVVGLLVAAGWLVLAALLDMASGSLPGGRRIAWTAGVVAAAFISPVIPAAALQAAATAA